MEDKPDNKPEDKPEDKRRDQRLAIESSMTLMVFDNTASGVVSGAEMIKLRSATIINISASGMRISTNDLLDPWIIFLTNGTILLALRFQLPGTGSINAIGRVVWVKIGEKAKYILGLRFTSIKDEDKKLISQFVAGHE